MAEIYGIYGMGMMQSVNNILIEYSCLDNRQSS